MRSLIEVERIGFAPRLIRSVRRNKTKSGKIAPISGDIAGKQTVTLHGRMRANQEIGKHRRTHPAALSIFQKNLARQKGGVKRNGLPIIDGSQSLVCFFDEVEIYRYFRKYYGVNDEAIVVGGIPQSIGGPRLPHLILRKKVQDNVAVDENR